MDPLSYKEPDLRSTVRTELTRRSLSGLESFKEPDPKSKKKLTRSLSDLEPITESDPQSIRKTDMTQSITDLQSAKETTPSGPFTINDFRINLLANDVQLQILGENTKTNKYFLSAFNSEGIKQIFNHSFTSPSEAFEFLDFSFKGLDPDITCSVTSEGEISVAQRTKLGKSIIVCRIPLQMEDLDPFQVCKRRLKSLPIVKTQPLDAFEREFANIVDSLIKQCMKMKKEIEGLKKQKSSINQNL